ncbi:protein of unknown function [Taphrina deformans PYCC 5710]|uniref:Asl1-like glycosyl hydrolase catalytic domain-containing protein n=1 Tax=Taphrina deformans (strain PYCC 5710 / ATCC 11124 / CBS 356.35 / IMI 108563 / JCM 9778 / NBRC 8474) TaxID=1097556 RepID=R4XER9_TAPDE|nr:protein of unknown function [Taphrina deformans PYCC 5710]|eukprot:CCG84276.1 protein of unknown function [Taphrina deformans PYCC 5710]
MRCAGDNSQFCGGSNAINTMHTAITTAATSSSKRGLCWPWNNDKSIFSLFDPSKETWVYNWEMWSPLTGSVYTAAQYVGMVRDPTRLNQISWYYTSTSQVSPYLLGFNEPDLPGDTFVSVADAVTSWQQYFLPARKSYGTILGAPAVTNAVQTNWGIDWLNQFNAACRDTTTTPGTTKSCFDFIPLHWYGYTLSDFQNYVSNFHSVYPNYPLWITEFAFTGHDAASVAVLERQALAWLDSQSYVARYSMFGPMNAANMAGIDSGAMLTDDQTALTTVGQIYAGLA